MHENRELKQTVQLLEEDVKMLESRNQKAEANLLEDRVAFARQLSIFLVKHEGKGKSEEMEKFLRYVEFLQEPVLTTNRRRLEEEQLQRQKAESALDPGAEQ